MPTNPLQTLRRFRLGYPVQRDYPWAYITLVTAILFIGLTVFFILLNIPLTAYEIATIDSINPNVSQHESPPMFFNLLPSSLRPSPGDFSPQTIRLGDTISTNMSIFNYHITDIIRDNQSQDSLPWNNQILASCNVRYMTLEKGNDTMFSLSHLEAIVNCWEPSVVTLSIDLDRRFLDMPGLTLTRQAALPLVIRTLLAFTMYEFNDIWEDQRPFLEHQSGGQKEVSNLTIDVTPCCECRSGIQVDENLDGKGETFITAGTGQFSGHPPCNDVVPTKLSTNFIEVDQEGSGSWTNPIRTSGTPDATGGLDFLSGAPLNASTELKRSLHNIFQLFYHAIHTDLGVHAPNNVFTSLDVFNRTLISADRTLYPWFFDRYSPYPPLEFDRWPLNLNSSDRSQTPSQLAQGIMARVWAELKNGTEASQMSLGELTTWAKVPRLSYITPVFRRKSTASAAASVFVASFAMISASWKAWNLLLTFLAGLRKDVSEEGDCKLCTCPKCSQMFSRLLGSHYDTEKAKGLHEMASDDFTTINSSHGSARSFIPVSRRTGYGYRPVDTAPNERLSTDLEKGTHSS